MNIITTAYNKILEGIQYLRDVAESIQKFIDTVSTIVSGAYHFLKPIFSFLPWEVWILLAVTVFLLSWVNSLFPSSPRRNYTFIVVFLCFAWAYAESSAYPEEGASWGRIIRAGLYLLIPVYFLSFVGFVFRRTYRFYFRKRRLNPKNLDEFLIRFEEESRRLTALGHLQLTKDSEESEFLQKLDEVSLLLKSFRAKLEESENAKI